MLVYSLIHADNCYIFIEIKFNLFTQYCCYSLLILSYLYSRLKYWAGLVGYRRQALCHRKVSRVRLLASLLAARTNHTIEFTFKTLNILNSIQESSL